MNNNNMSTINKFLHACQKSMNKKFKNAYIHLFRKKCDLYTN